MKAFYIAGTHWDREWYEPFQEYRMWLVQTIDQAMDVIEADSDFAVWHLDGQTVAVEDYLEIRPDQRDRLLGHIRDGRLPAGPWYVLPDQWLVSGEALVRNLQVGMKRLRDLGCEPMMVGYTPDMFGHLATLPTILAGFDLKGCVMWRGAHDDYRGAQFVWRGPDGTGILTHKLPDQGGYGAFLIGARGPWMAEGRTDEKLDELIGGFVRAETERQNAPVMFIPDALDHDGADPDAPRILEFLRGRFPDDEFIHANMEQYFDELAEHRAELPEGDGEMRATARDPEDGQWLIPHTLSSRYPLKLLNDRCQNLLQLWAEPLAVMAALSGKSVPPGYLETAWVWLLKNQPHDSICGCSIDETHDDMMFRYHQCELLGDGVRRQAMAALARPTSNLEAAHANVVVWNPLPWEREEVAVLDIVLPSGFQPKVSMGHSGPVVAQFEVVGADGEAIHYQHLAIERHRQVQVPNEEGRRRNVTGDWGGGAEVHRVALPVKLPAGGFTTLNVRPLTDRCHRDTGTLRTGPLSAENELLRVELQPDGTATLTDMSTGRAFAGLLCYEDGGDAGDGWTYIPPFRDEVVVSPGHTVQCGVEQDGSHLVTFRVRRTLSVPAGLGTRGDECRSDERVDMVVTDYVTLRAGAACLEVRTVVENNARDHRLRVLLPSGVASDTCYADTAFGFVERPVAVDPDNSRYKEADPETRPHQGIFGIGDAGGGLAVVCPEGLHEHAVLDDGQRTLALTLLRGFRRTVGTDGEPGGQMLGTHEFAYALLPCAGALDRVAALRLTAELQAGVYRHFAEESPGERSLVRLSDGPVVATSIKPAWDDGSTVLRLWNTSDQAAEAELHLDAQVQGAWLSNLNEEPREELSVDGQSVRVEVAALGLATVRVKTQ